MKKKRYFIYARSAVKSQTGEYLENHAQTQLLKGLAEKRNFGIADVISEYGSGMFNKRRGFIKLLRRLKKGEAQGILCMDWNRLTRDLVLSIKLKDMFERNGIDVITLKESDKSATKI